MRNSRGRRFAAVVVGGFLAVALLAAAPAQAAKPPPPGPAATLRIAGTQTVAAVPAREGITFDGQLTSSFTYSVALRGGGTKGSVSGSSPVTFTPAAGAGSQVSANFDFQGTGFTDIQVTKPPRAVEGQGWYVANFGSGWSTLVVYRQCHYDDPENSTGECRLDLKDLSFTFLGGTADSFRFVQAGAAAWADGRASVSDLSWGAWQPIS